MTSRFLKQLKIAFLFFLPVFIFLSFKIVPLLLTPPSCFDNKKNQGEIDVDCGGPCPPCEIKNLQPLTISSLRKIKYSDGSYDLAGKVFNPNEKWGLKEITYSFVLFDDQGKKIYETTKEKSIIYPNESRWLILQNLKLPEFSSFKLNLEIDNYNWQQMENNSSPLYLINYEPTFEKTPFGNYRIFFNVYNKSIYDFDNVEAIVFIYDENREIIGLNRVNFKINHDTIEKVEFINNTLDKEPKGLEIFFQLSQ